MSPRSKHVYNVKIDRILSLNIKIESPPTPCPSKCSTPISKKDLIFAKPSNNIFCNLKAELFCGRNTINYAGMLV